MSNEKQPLAWYFSPLPRYSHFNAASPDHNREHWIDLWHLPAPAIKYYLYFLSKLANGSATSIPLSDAEVTSYTGEKLRTVADARRACEQCRLIERVYPNPRGKDIYLYRLPAAISQQKPMDTGIHVSTESTSKTEISGNPVTNKDTSKTDNYGLTGKTYTDKREKRKSTENPTPPETTPPLAGDALPSTPLLDIKLLRFKDSIREYIIFNKEDYEQVKLGDTTRNRISDEVDDKLAAIVEGFSQYEAEEVLTIVEELVETRKWRSPVMLRADNEANMAEIKFQLDSARDDRPKLRGGDTVRRTKDTVPENIVKEWIEDQVNQNTIAGISWQNGKASTDLVERSDEDKDLLRRTMLDKHEWGELDYQEIHDWQHQPERPAKRKRKRAAPPDDTVTNRSLTLAEIVGEENQKHQKEESKE